MVVGDHQLHAAQAAAGEAAQEPGPEGLGLGRADRHAEDLAPALVVDRDRDGHRDRYDAPGLAHLQIGRIQPEIGPVTPQRPVEESSGSCRRSRRTAWRPGLLEMPDIPIACTRSSTERVDTPWM